MAESAVVKEQLTGLMIDAGADVEAWDNNGNTALIIASRFRHTEVVRLLRKASAGVKV